VCSHVILNGKELSRFFKSFLLGTVLKDTEHSITFKITCERPEIKDVKYYRNLPELKFWLCHECIQIYFNLEQLGILPNIINASVNISHDKDIIQDNNQVLLIT